MHCVDTQMLAFTGLVTILIITPGANTMLITRSVLTRGQNAGFIFMFGGCMGVCFHAVLSICGLSLILVQCAEVYETVKLLGALYLIYLGAQSIRRATRGRTGDFFSSGSGPDAACGKPARRSFVEGLTTIMLSPETSVFYLAILPQFISSGESVIRKSIILAAIHILIRVIWYSFLTLFVGRMTAFLKRPRVHRWLELSTGGVLVFLGLQVAVAKR